MTPTLVLTRPPADSQRFIDRIKAQARVSSIVSPAFRVVPVAARIDDVPTHVVFTSAQAVAQAGRFDLGGAHAWCVGQRTTEAARTAGFVATDGGGDVQHLAQTLISARPMGQIVHLRGRHAAGDLKGDLAAEGLSLVEVICYAQEPLLPAPPLVDAAKGTTPLVIPLFSPRAALLLGTLDGPAPLHVVAMSDAVAAACEGLLVETVTVAGHPTEDAMLATTLAVLQELSAESST